MSIITGSTPASANVWNRARGVRPSSLAFSSLMISSAAEPSVICDEFAAVTTPSGLKAGFSLASVSIDESGRMPSSVRMVSLPSSVVMSIGTISRSKRPSAVALRGPPVRLDREAVVVLTADVPLLGDQLGRDALRHEVRVALEHLRAERHAAGDDRRAHRHAASCSRCPAAITTSYAPAITPCAAKWAACCDEPHWRSTDVPTHRLGEARPRARRCGRC